jgi:hypothetical protein
MTTKPSVGVFVNVATGDIIIGGLEEGGSIVGDTIGNGANTGKPKGIPGNVLVVGTPVLPGTAGIGAVTGDGVTPKIGLFVGDSNAGKDSGDRLGILS